MKEKIENFSLKQQILKYSMQNIVRYIASETPESTQTPSHTILSVWREHRSLLCSLSFWAGWWYSYEMLALDYTYRDIETETQYKHTNWPLCTLLEFRAVTYLNLTSFEHYRDFCCCDEHGGWSMARVLMDACYYWPSLWTVDLLPSILINYSVKCPANNRRNANQ